MCRSFVAWPLWVLGYPDQALQSIHEALAQAQEFNHPFTLALALVQDALVHQFRREVLAVREHAGALIALSTDHGFPYWVDYGTILQGWALAAQGEGTEGVVLVRQGLVARRARGAELHRPYFLALLAEAQGKVGQIEEGLSVLNKALNTVNKTEERNWEAELHRLKGELLLIQQGQKVGEAEECFQKALDIARRQQAKSLELRASMSLSRLWQQQGKKEEARHLLAEIYDWFTEGFDTADLKEAKTLLEELA